MSVITQDGDSALMTAARRGKTEVVVELVKAGGHCWTCRIQYVPTQLYMMYRNMHTLLMYIILKVKLYPT